MPISTRVVLRLGELTGLLETKCIVLSAIDSFIAEIALDGQFTLATRHTDDFRDTGVSLFNPWLV